MSKIEKFIENSITIKTHFDKDDEYESENIDFSIIHSQNQVIFRNTEPDEDDEESIYEPYL